MSKPITNVQLREHALRTFFIKSTLKLSHQSKNKMALELQQKLHVQTGLEYH
jgi:hypothetical protein